MKVKFVILLAIRSESYLLARFIHSAIQMVAVLLVIAAATGHRLYGDVINPLGLSQQPKSVNSKAVQDIAEALKSRQLGTARDKIKELCEADPNESHPEIVLSELLVRMGNIAEARRILDEASLGDCDPFELRLAFCRLAVAESRWFDGWTHAQAANGLAPPARWSSERKERQQDDLLILSAICCEGRKDWKGVVSTLKPLLSRSPPPQALLLCGKACFQLEQLDNAKQALDRYCDATQTGDSAELILAKWYDGNGDSKSAEQWFLKAVETKQIQGQIKARLTYARFLLWNNRPAEMTKWLQGDFTSPDDLKERTFLTALQFRMQRKYADAQKILTEQHQREPTAFPISNQLALVLIESADEALRSRALQIAESNVRNHAKIAEALSTLGWVQFRLGDVASADKSFSAAVQNGFTTRESTYCLARVKESLGQVEMAASLRRISQGLPGPLFSSITDAIVVDAPAQ